MHTYLISLFLSLLGSPFHRSLEDKLCSLRSQLEKLRDGSDPDYQQAVRELESVRDNRLFVADVFRQYELATVQQEFEREKAIAVQQLEAKQQDLKECLLQDLQDKRKAYDSYRHGVEVNSICKLHHTAELHTCSLTNTHILS